MRVFSWGVVFLFLTAISGAFADGWTLRKDETGVQIYTREVKDSPIAEFKGVVRVRGTLASVEALINDIAAAPRWIEYSKEGRLIQQVSQDESLTYTLTAMPWPLQNRDAIVRNKRSASADGAVTISFAAEPDALPAVADVVRIRSLSGSWRLVPQGDSVELTYTVHSDPGGIPGWLVNLGIVDQPFKTLQRVQGMLSQQGGKP